MFGIPQSKEYCTFLKLRDSIKELNIQISGIYIYIPFTKLTTILFGAHRLLYIEVLSELFSNSKAPTVPFLSSIDILRDAIAPKDTGKNPRSKPLYDIDSIVKAAVAKTNRNRDTIGIREDKEY